MVCLAGTGALSCHRKAAVVAACTLIGCNDSLRIILAPVAVLPYRATLVFPAGQAVAFQCAADGVRERTGDGIYSLACGAESFMLLCSRNPSYCSTNPVRVEVLQEDGVTRSCALTPLYTIQQPHGPGCEPTCYVGVATLP